MSAISKRTFSLPVEQSEFIDKQVDTGTYGSASEVVRAGLRALQERDAAIERWLREEVAPNIRSYVGQSCAYLVFCTGFLFDQGSSPAKIQKAS